MEHSSQEPDAWGLGWALWDRGCNAFVVDTDPPGAMTIAVDDDLLYIGPFALPRNA